MAEEWMMILIVFYIAVFYALIGCGFALHFLAHSGGWEYWSLSPLFAVFWPLIVVDYCLHWREERRKLRYVARAEAGTGWKVWDRKTKRSWGNYFHEYPESLLQELNGPKRPEKLVELCRLSFSKNK
jgi:hypothetical protein